MSGGTHDRARHALVGVQQCHVGWP
jgi:hypothetical protein